MLSSALLALPLASVAEAAPQRIIVDTDMGFDVDDDQETVIVEEDDNAADTEISVPSKKRSPAKPKAATDSCDLVDDQVDASSLLVFFCTQLHLLHSCVCGHRRMQWLHP